ncbi:MAG: hypothetical protein AAF889_14455, partial [Cyanobacteria bacterium P01_D01_bin.73]
AREIQDLSADEFSTKYLEELSGEDISTAERRRRALQREMGIYYAKDRTKYNHALDSTAAAEMKDKDDGFDAEKKKPRMYTSISALPIVAGSIATFFIAVRSDVGDQKQPNEQPKQSNTEVQPGVVYGNDFLELKFNPSLLEISTIAIGSFLLLFLVKTGIGYIKKNSGRFQHALASWKEFQASEKLEESEEMGQQSGK